MKKLRSEHKDEAAADHEQKDEESDAEDIVMKKPGMNKAMTLRKNVQHKKPAVNTKNGAPVKKRPNAHINLKKPIVLGCVKRRGMSCNTCRSPQCGGKRLSRQSWLKLGRK